MATDKRRFDVRVTRAHDQNVLILAPSTVPRPDCATSAIKCDLFDQSLHRASVQNSKFQWRLPTGFEPPLDLLGVKIHRNATRS